MPRMQRNFSATGRAKYADVGIGLSVANWSDTNQLVKAQFTIDNAAGVWQRLSLELSRDEARNLGAKLIQLADDPIFNQA